jgi:tRNA modification GTPase
VSLEDTIIAPATATGRASVNILRISGKNAIKQAQKLFRTNQNKPVKSFQSHKIYHGWIENKNKKIDEVLLLIMKAPKSYTKEDVVEVHSHGGFAVCNKLLEVFLEQGIRMAENGEFTKRAFLNGRIDLTKAEAIQQIIDAQNLFALESGVEQLQGKIYEKIQDFQKKISWVLSLLNAQIDFIDEKVFFTNQEKSRKELQSIILQIQNFLLDSEQGIKLQEGIKVVLMGKTNVGKSSIMNGIMRENRVIVTPEAGTTRDIIQESASIKGISFVFSDTAGIRQTDSVVEKEGINKSWEISKKADILLWVLDSNCLDLNIPLRKFSKKTPILLVFNKIDLVDKGLVAKKIPSDTQKIPKIFISAFLQEDIKKLEQKIFDLYFEKKKIATENVFLSNQRQKNAAKRALKHLKSAMSLIKENAGEEMICFELEQSLRELAAIVGETTTEDLLDQIFCNFCIGK